MSDKTLTKPTIHLNGTPVDRLIEGYVEAGSALFTAVRAVASHTN